MEKISRYRAYFVLVVSDIISDFGDSLFYLALMTYVVSLRDAKVVIAIVTFAEVLPRILTFLTGIFADRTRKKLLAIFATLYLRILLFVCIGILMGFNPTLWIVIVVTALRFIADISGQYESNLFIPLSLPLVDNEDREQMLATSQSLKQACSVGFQIFSTGLVLFISYQAFAFINAGTFAVSLLLIFLVRARLKVATLPVTQPSPDAQVSTKAKHSIINQYRHIVITLQKFPECLLAICVAPFLNGVLNSINAILVLVLSTDPNFAIIDQKFTLALFSLVASVASVTGSILTFGPLQKVRLGILLRIVATAPIFIYGAFLFHNLCLVMFAVAVTFLAVSSLTPKLNAIVLNNLPSESIATVVGALGTIMQTGIIVMSICISGLIIIVPTQIVIAICLGSAIAVAVGTLYLAAKKGV